MNKPISYLKQSFLWPFALKNSARHIGKMIPICTVFLFGVLLLCSCDNKKGPMTLHGNQADIVIYETALGKYFNVHQADTPGKPSRYEVFINPDAATITTAESYNGNGFFIAILDQGGEIKALVVFTVGGKGSKNSTIVNPNLSCKGGGICALSKDVLSITPQASASAAERAAAISEMINKELIKIEGK